MACRLSQTLGVMSSLPPITGTMHAVQGNDFIAPAGPPHTYLGMARALLHGILPLATAGPNSSIALAFVAGQVAECALKAYLSRGGDDKRLKDPTLRHNLAALWQLAQSEGLPVSPQSPTWLVTLSGLHNTPYFIRYSTHVHGLVTPAAEPMATDLVALVEVVGLNL
jgi:hypothetical protein